MAVLGCHLFYQESNLKWTNIASEHHEYYDKLNPYTQSLFNRNVGIVLNSDCIIALPDMNKNQWGGTGHSMRIAEHYKIPILNISENNILSEIKQLVKVYLND